MEENTKNGIRMTLLNDSYYIVVGYRYCIMESRESKTHDYFLNMDVE